MSPEEWLASQSSQAEPISPEQWAASQPTAPSTTAQGVTGAVTRGAALPVMGAALGAAMGAPFAGVGAVPGAIAGAGAATLAGMVGDPVVGSINSLLGTKYTLPTQAMEDLLTRLGVAEPKTAAERIIQTTTAGASGAIGGVALGKAVEAAASSPVTKAVGQAMATTPTFQALTGATSAGSGQVAKEAGAGPVGQVAAQVAGAIIPSAPSLVRNLTGQAAKAIAPQGAGIKQLGAPTTIEQLRLGNSAPAAPTTRESLQSIKATVGEKAADVLALPNKQAEIARIIKTAPDSVDAVQYRLSGTQVVPDNQASEAIKQGWKDGAIASIKAASDKDRQAMTKMVNIFKLGEKSDSFRALNRPADILGDSVQARVDFLANANQKAGKTIDRIAQTKLRGKPVNYDPAMNSFLDELDSIGVKVEMGSDGVAKANLKGSDIQGDKGAQRILNTVLERLSTINPPDAYGVHTAKRFIDTQVNYGKKNLANPLTQQAERALKNLRRGLNESLGEQTPVYKAANEKYADTITALNDLQKAAGTNIDFESPSANKALGSAMRKLTSNYGTRANLIDSLDQASQISTKYGMKLDDNVVNQLIFVNELDRMFGAVADTSLKGQVGQAMETGIEIARGNIASRAVDLLAEKAQNLRGVNKDNAIKAMEEILKRKSE